MAKQQGWARRSYLLWVSAVALGVVAVLWTLTGIRHTEAIVEVAHLPPAPLDGSVMTGVMLASEDPSDDEPAEDVASANAPTRVGPIILTSANGPDGVRPEDVAATKPAAPAASSAKTGTLPRLLPDDQITADSLPSLGDRLPAVNDTTPKRPVREEPKPVAVSTPVLAANPAKTIASPTHEASGVVELPSSGQPDPDTAASTPSPLHWDLFADIPSASQASGASAPQSDGPSATTAAKQADIPAVREAPIEPAPRAASESSPTTDKKTAEAQQQPTPRPSPRVQSPARMLDDAWQEPTALTQSLRELTADRTTEPWATETLRQTLALGRAFSSRSNRTDVPLGRLRDLSRQGIQTAEVMPEGPLTSKLRRTAFALDRRIELWQQLVLVNAAPAVASSVSRLNHDRLARHLANIKKATGNSPEGRAWRKYLLVESLEEGLARRPKGESNQMRRTAQRALVRLTQVPMTTEQQQFISSAPVTALRDELRHWAAEPISTVALLRDIERYETTGLQSDSYRLARDCQFMAESPVEARRNLATCVQHRYFDANFRMAVTAELLNDMIPERDLEYRQFNETVQGRPTSGRSVMATETTVRMLPDPKRVRMALEVRGEIQSNSTTDASPARFFSQSQAWYIARKPLEIDMKGLTLWPAEVDVHNDTQLNGVDTKLGNVPVIGFIIAQAAKGQYEQNKPAASREVEQKIIREASERVDAEAKQQLTGVVAKLNERVFDPLNNLALGPQMVDARTTEQRFTMRLRVGGEDQVGGHTPRPQAPSDSLASVQLHESALNNSLKRLQLEGRAFTLPELARHVGKCLNCDPWKVAPENEDVKLTLAPQDAIVVRFQDGQIMLTFSVQRLSRGPHRWSNFQVRAFYRPDAQDCKATLTRNGVIRLMGPRLSTGSQIALRGIFSHALSKKTPFSLIPQQIANNPKLKDAAVTQFVIEDGWLGIALGPNRNATRSASTPDGTPRG